MARLALGLDFGTESARALLVDTADGRELATAVCAYPHGVVDDCLPGTGEVLPPDWALQDADDYWAALEVMVPTVLRESGTDPGEIIGIGVDFTACTLVPCLADGTPLSRLARYRGRPHAWTKLWKHHGANDQAERINALAAERSEDLLDRYGGRGSSEWLFPKALELLEAAPDLYAAADRLIEAGDWLVWQLTGSLTRSACQAGYKGMFSSKSGYPSEAFLKALHPGLGGIVREKLVGPVLPVGDLAGSLTAAAAARLGLNPGTPVAVSIIDAHAAVPGAGVTGPGEMLLILGTSACHMVLSPTGDEFPGVAGVVEHGIMPGYFGYEAGQPATGDLLGWYTRTGVPAALTDDAAARGVSTHQVLTELAAGLPPGGSGMLALDWWNGNRSVLMDADLSGVLLGLTLDTRPEQIYHALIEGTAFGTRMILENFAEHGVPVASLTAAGGLADRNELLMQIYADVTGRPIRLARSHQTCALGAAIFGAAAAGQPLEECVRRMGGAGDRTYEPSPTAHGQYTRLFAEWRRLHDYFGRGENDVLKLLRARRAG